MSFRRWFSLFLVLLLLVATPLSADETQYQPGQVIVKFSPQVGQVEVQQRGEQVEFGVPSLDLRLQRHGVCRARQVFPHKRSSMAHIYELGFDPRHDALAVARDLALDEHLLYAEPRYIEWLCDVPNDPQYLTGAQWYLDQVHAAEAWNVVHGDSSVIIAIVDSGADWDHPDLEGNIWINPGEDIDGDGRITGADWNVLDDDGNGYVDDFFGWDFGGAGYPDWNPMENPGPYGSHGSHCAGVASAMTDNGMGVASMAWNCSIMAVKVTEDLDPAVRYGYEGIQYAADNGADVISISWGRSLGVPSQFQQEVIDSAFAKGCVIVAAAGNDPGTAPPDTCRHYWPAWYDHVTAVAATDTDDRIPEWSFYGSWVDVCAPGVDIYSTFWDDTYGMRYGTSMAAPLVAGVAGLLKTIEPDMDSDQFEQRMRAASDGIDELNPGYEGWLGGGRLNAYRALQEGVPVVLASFQAVGGQGHITLTWVTASEVDCQSWEIFRRQRSDDGYVRIGNLSGRGSSESAHRYQWIDRDVVAGVTYFYKLRQVDHGGMANWSPIVMAVATATIPTDYTLHQNHPNPFNAATRVCYDIPEDGHITVRIFNALGQEVRRLVEGPVVAGWHQILWDGRDANGREISSGLYFCRMEAGGYGRTIKMVLVR